MSHISVHDRSAAARQGAGRLYQVAALARPLAGPLGDLYALNRTPYDHMLPPWGAPQVLTLPRDALLTPEAEQAIAARAAPRQAPAPRARPGAAACEARSYVLRLVLDAGANVLRAISTGVLPTPCIITGFDIHTAISGISPDKFFGVAVNTSDITGAQNAASGESLFDVSHELTSVGADNAHWTSATPIELNEAAIQRSHIGYAQQLIGRLITDEGARLTLYVRYTAGASDIITAVVSVQQCAAELGVVPRAVAPRREPAPPRAPAAAPRERAAPKPPPPPAYRPPQRAAAARPAQVNRQIYWIGTQPRMHITDAQGRTLIDAPLGSPELTAYSGEAAAAGVPAFAEGAAFLAGRGALPAQQVFSR